MTLTTTNCKAYLVVSNARLTARSPTHTGTQPTFLSTWYRTRSSLSCQHLLCTHQLPATALRAQGGHRKVALLARRIKISLLLGRRKAAQKAAAAGLPKFVHVVCVNFAWLKGDTNNQGQESKRTNRCTSPPQETPKKTWVQEGPLYTKYDTCTGFDRNETASAGKKQEHGQPVFARADNCGQLVAVPHKTKAMKPKTTKEATTFHAPLKKNPANKRAAKHKRAASLHGKHVVKGTVTPCLGRALRRPLREVQHPACTAGCPPATGTAGSSTSGHDAHPACLPDAFAVDGVGTSTAAALLWCQ